MHGGWGRTTQWHPDALFYEARVLELRGAEEDAALREVLSGLLADGVSDVVRDAEWVDFNRDLYRRRVVVPALAAAVEPVAGVDSLQLVSLLGYVALAPLLYLLVRRRFDVPTAALASAVVLLLPSLRFWSAQPLTDSTGLALETLALLAAALALDRGGRWLALWVPTVLALGFTRDATVVVVVAAILVAIHQRSRVSLALLATGILASLPAPLLFGSPLRRSLAFVVDDRRVPADDSWGFVVRGYPHALWRTLEADGHVLLRDTPVTAAVVVAAVVALVVTTRAADPFVRLARGAALGCVLMVLLQPNPTGLRLELVLVPVLAIGIALVLDGVRGRLRERATGRQDASNPAGGAT